MRLSWLCIVLLLIGGSWQATARRPRQAQVQVELVRQHAASTGDPARQLYEFEVRCTNLGSQAVAVSNNQFFVLDDQGARHGVERGRYADRQLLDPGKAVVFAKIYIGLPRDRKPLELHLLNYGSCRLK